MKKLISVLMLICIMASFCTVSAFAVTDITVKGDVYEEQFYFNVTSEREAIGFNMFFPETESFETSAIVIELYSGETLMSTTTNAKALTANKSLTVNIVFAGKASSSWNTVWNEFVTDLVLPDSVVITANGYTETFGLKNQSNKVPTLVTSKPVYLSENGTVIGFYDTIDEAIEAASDGATIEIRKEGTYVLPETDKSLTIKTRGISKDKVTIKSDVPVADKGNLNLDGVTVDAPPPPSCKSLRCSRNC